MAIITKPATINKDEAAVITLDKDELASVASVAGDAYFSVQSNWKKVLLHYLSDFGGQVEVVSFDATLASPEANFLASATARDNFEIHKIIIEDFDNGRFIVDRSELTVAEFDVALSGGGPVLENVVLTSFLGTDTFTVTGNSVEKTAGGSSYDSNIRSTQVIEDNAYFQIGNTSSSPFNQFWYCGLAKDPRTTGSIADWAYAVNRADFSYSVYENGVQLFVLNTPPVAGDKIGISIEAGVVKYAKNGTIFYTSSNAPSGQYYLQISLYAVGVSVDSLEVYNPV